MTLPNHGVKGHFSVFRHQNQHALKLQLRTRFYFPNLCFDAKSDDTVVPATFTSKQGLLHGSLVNMMLNNC